MIAEILLAALLLTAQPAEPVQTWDGPALTAYMGVNLDGPSGVETWYNMPMDGFIQFIYSGTGSICITTKTLSLFV